jgi:hypothetical protein
MPHQSGSHLSRQHRGAQSRWESKVAPWQRCTSHSRRDTGIVCLRCHQGSTGKMDRRRVALADLTCKVTVLIVLPNGCPLPCSSACILTAWGQNLLRKGLGRWPSWSEPGSERIVPAQSWRGCSPKGKHPSLRRTPDVAKFVTLSEVLVQARNPRSATTIS